MLLENMENDKIRILYKKCSAKQWEPWQEEERINWINSQNEDVLFAIRHNIVEELEERRRLGIFKGNYIDTETDDRKREKKDRNYIKRELQKYGTHTILSLFYHGNRFARRHGLPFFKI